MVDLLGDEIRAPDPAVGFDQFWAAWPRNPRKVARKQCMAKWAKQECASHTNLILAHLEFMKKHRDWLKDDGAYIPLPMTYLNQARWEAFLEETEAMDTRQAVEAAAVAAGHGKWDEIREQFGAYKARILRACGIGGDRA